jgi:hypothetical protein
MKKAIIGFAAVAVLLSACGEEEGITRPPPANMPADCVENVEISFDRRDIDTLKKCLSADFIFYFDPDDVGQRPPGSEYVIPESWSYTEFWSVANRIFQMAYYISLSIPTSQIGTPGAGQTTYKAENVSISLLVMVDENYGYVADGGYCNFAFEAYHNEKKEKVWRLAGWWDYTSEFFDEYPALTPASLGKILAIYK